jgi:hypothetical protein
VEIIFVTKFCDVMTRGLCYLQNEAGVAELDDAREKAAEVLKRLLHTQKVSTAAFHCIAHGSLSVYNFQFYSVQYLLFCYVLYMVTFLIERIISFLSSRVIFSFLVCILGFAKSQVLFVKYIVMDLLKPCSTIDL